MRPIALILALSPALPGLAACSDAGSTPVAAADGAQASANDDASAPAEAVAAWQRELLDLAFDLAAQFPLNPHHKDRGRAEEVVVLACLDLDAPELALEYNARVSNWRRGAGYADISAYMVEQGMVERGEVDADRIADYLAEARRIAPTAEGWRKDRILAKVARAYALQGLDAQVAQVASGISAIEASRVTEAYAGRVDAAGARRQVQAIDALVNTATLEEVRGALDACVALHARFYEDEALRGEIEASIMDNIHKVPLDMRIEVLYALADNELERDAAERAIARLDTAAEWRGSAHWPAEYGTPLAAGEAARRYLAGDTKEGLALFAAARADYERDVEAGILVDFFRREALLPLAEAYLHAGLRDRAVETYREAVIESGKNANARPRTDDMVAVMCSMAANGVEPDEALLERIHATADAIRETWAKRDAQ